MLFLLLVVIIVLVIVLNVKNKRYEENISNFISVEKYMKDLKKIENFEKAERNKQYIKNLDLEKQIKMLKNKIIRLEYSVEKKNNKIRELKKCMDNKNMFDISNSLNDISEQNGNTNLVKKNLQNYKFQEEKIEEDILETKLEKQKKEILELIKSEVKCNLNKKKEKKIPKSVEKFLTLSGSFETYCAGLTYEGRETKLSLYINRTYPSLANKIRERNTVYLEKEFNNEYDKNAIKIIHKNIGHIGYIPKKHNKALIKYTDINRIRIDLYINYNENLDRWFITIYILENENGNRNTSIDKSYYYDDEYIEIK